MNKFNIWIFCLLHFHWFFQFLDTACNTRSDVTMACYFHIVKISLLRYFHSVKITGCEDITFIQLNMIDIKDENISVHWQYTSSTRRWNDSYFTTGRFTIFSFDCGLQALRSFACQFQCDLKNAPLLWRRRAPNLDICMALNNRGT